MCGDPNENKVSIQEKESVEKSLYILQNETDDWENIVAHWKNTFNTRKEWLVEEKLPVNDYINKFPAFSLASGFELVSEFLCALLFDCMRLYIIRHPKNLTSKRLENQNNIGSKTRNV